MRIYNADPHCFVIRGTGGYLFPCHFTVNLTSFTTLWETNIISMCAAKYVCKDSPLSMLSNAKDQFKTRLLWISDLFLDLIFENFRYR